MSDSLLEAIQALKQRAERLEQEASELRQELTRLAEVMTSPSAVVARYVIEGETYEITQHDVELARAGLAKPWAESAVYELAVIKKVAEKLHGLSPEEQNDYFSKLIEAIWPDALENETAIDTRTETKIGGCI